MHARNCAAAALTVAVSLLAGAVPAADDARPSRKVPPPKPEPVKKAGKLPPLSKEARRVADELKKKLPPGSEARLMLDDILKGSRLGPNDGWFRVARGKTRFGWEYVARTFDRDKDGKVTQAEFRGKPVDFRRLDGNGDGVLTEADFASGEGGFAPSPGAMLFQMADRDGNGHISKQEFDALFESLDSGRRGFLSLDDLKDRLRPPPRSSRKKRSGGPSRNTLVLALARQELGALPPGPGLNEPAPDFTLRILNDLKRVTLSKEVGDKPVVLIFGSFT